MALLMALTTCEACGADIHASNVFKTVVLPGAIGHLALVYRCPSCATVDKTAASNEEWEHAAEQDEDIRKAMAGAHIDVESIENVDDLLAEWSVGPVLREEIMYLCKCDTCRKRLHG